MYHHTNSIENFKKQTHIKKTVLDQLTRFISLQEDLRCLPSSTIYFQIKVTFEL